jgi:hypothetical protein
MRIILQACLPALLFWLFTAPCEAQLDPKRLTEARQLVINEQMPDPILRELGKLFVNGPDEEATPEKEEKFRKLRAQYLQRLHQRIRTEPGLKPYLFQLIEESYNPRKPLGDLDRALKALAIRDDLKPNDVAPIRREMGKILADPESPFGRDDSRRARQEQYLASGMAVLTRDMTPETEDLALQALTWNDRTVYAGAANALAKTGVIRALPEMEKLVKRLATKKDPWEKSMRELCEELKRNAAQKPTPKQSLPTPVSPSFPK